MNPAEKILRSIAASAVGVVLEAVDVYPDPKRRKHAEDELAVYLAGALERRGLTIVSEVKA